MFSKIKLMETLRSTDFKAYTNLLLREGLFISYLFVILINKYDKDKSFFVIKYEETVIGGFFLTKSPLVKYEPQFFFNKEVRTKINNFVKEGYGHLCGLLIQKNYRKIGIGQYIFDIYFKYNSKIWTVSNPEVKNFCMRNNVQVIDILYNKLLCYI